MRRLPGVPAWLLFVVGYFAGLTLLQWQAASSMVLIWMRSDTFAHGFLILPIAIWLAWRDREELVLLPWKPAPRLLMVCLALAAVALLGYLVDVQVLQQLTYVAALIAGTWAIVGNALARRLWFPLCFLFLAVPMGLSLEPPMMDLTAEWTVRLIRWTGIPVYQQGRFFQLPSGSWSVVEACSGVRYLIASFTLGVLYAYLSYRAAWRRLLFVAMSILVPVIANVLRAYGIVMIGHLSDMRLATGVDHLVYGWLFFGVVMMLLFLLGNLWGDSVDGKEREGFAGKAPDGNSTDVASSALPVVVLSLACAALVPGFILLDQGPRQFVKDALLFQSVEGWHSTPIAQDTWQPPQRGAQRSLDVLVSSDDDSVVQLHLRQFIEQSQGSAELVSYGNPWLGETPDWRIATARRISVAALDDLSVREVELNGPHGKRLLAWSWYRIGERSTAEDLVAKLLEVRQGLTFQERTGAQVFLATSFGDAGELPMARGRLESFLIANRDALGATLVFRDQS